jgi:hypothetical protein
VKPIRWTAHALKNPADREVDRAQTDLALARPEFVVPGQLPCRIYMRRYGDTQLQQEMLLCLIVEETPDEPVVVSVYRTSQIARYLKGAQP